MTNDLRTRAREAAEEEYPREHVGYEKPPTERCGCDECYLSESKRLAYEAGYLAHAAQQPTRDQIARALFIASDSNRADQMARAWDAPGDGGRQRWWNYADAVLALFDGADRLAAEIERLRDDRDRWKQAYEMADPLLTDRDRLAATVDRVRELVDDGMQHVYVEQDDEYGVLLYDLRAAIEGTDS